MGYFKVLFRDIPQPKLLMTLHTLSKLNAYMTYYGSMSPFTDTLGQLSHKVQLASNAQL